MGNVSRAQQKLQKTGFFGQICMATVLPSGGAYVFVDESTDINQILTRCLNRFGDFHFLIRDADTVKINFRHDVCIWNSGLPVCGVYTYETCIYIYIEAKVRSFLPVISPCRLSRQHHWTQKNTKKRLLAIIRAFISVLHRSLR